MANMRSNWNRLRGTPVGMMLVFIAFAVTEPLFAADTTIDVVATSVFVTESSKAPLQSNALSRVPPEHTVTIHCRVGIYAQVPRESLKQPSPPGGATWKLAKTETAAHDGTVLFNPPLKVALTVNDQTVSIRSVGHVPGRIAYGYQGFGDPSDPSTNFADFFTHSAKPLHVSADWLFSAGGQQTLRCLADAGHTVSEKNESNNQIKSIVQVVGTVKLHDQPPTPAAPSSTAVPPQPVTRDVPSSASARRTSGATPASDPTSKARPAGASPPRKEPPPRSFDPASAYPGVPMSRGQTALQTYTAPTWRNRRVDWCLQVGAQCGEPAATVFCRRMGYPKATAWTIAKGVGTDGPTVVLGAGTSCTGPSCDGFASITCQK